MWLFRYFFFFGCDCHRLYISSSGSLHTPVFIEFIRSLGCHALVTFSLDVAATGLWGRDKEEKETNAHIVCVHGTHIPSGMDIVSFFSCVHTHTHINMEHGKIYTDDRWIRAVNFFSFFFRPVLWPCPMVCT